MEEARRFGKFLLLEQQEQTSNDQIWRGAELIHGKIDKYFLLGFLRDEYSGNRSFADYYLNQSQIAAKLEHPNILRKITSLSEAGKLVAVFEYNEGFSLETVLNRCRHDGFPLSIDHALLVTSKLLSALSYAKTRHISHGFVNPSVILVTHEGEIKLRGFAISAALRQGGVEPGFAASFHNYVPPGLSLISEERDRLDTYGCGALLFEMLTGQPFHEKMVDPGTRISSAICSADGEPIPATIAKMLKAALVPNSPGSYSDITQMAKDMEDLLFSGEYSPTTFNLAFFMHSAFRSEMEQLSEKIAREKETDFAAAAISAAPPRATSTSAPTVSDAKPIEREAFTGVATPPKKAAGKSKLPLLLGAVAIAAIIVVLVIFLKPSPESAESRKVKQLEAEIQREASLEEQERLRQQNEDLRLQSEELMRQLQTQAEQESQRKKDEIELELAQMDAQIADLKKKEEQKELMRQLDEERKQLDKERQALQSESQPKSATDNAVSTANPAALDSSKQSVPAKPGSDTTAGSVASAQPDAKKVSDKSADKSADKSKDPAVATVPPKGSETTAAGSIEAEANAAGTNSNAGAVPADRMDVVPETRPNEGDLISFDDEYLELPVLLEPYETLDAPKKAVKAGVVPRDKTVSFLMKLLVNQDGRVDEVELFRSPLKPFQDDFGMIERATKVSKKLRFSSPTKMGVKVKVWMYLPVHFKDK